MDKPSIGKEVRKFEVLFILQVTWPNSVLERTNDYAHDLYFAVLGCGKIPVDFTHILQGYFTSTRIALMAVK